MSAQAQTLPVEVDRALKQLIAARKKEIARLQEAKTANLKHIEAQNKRRDEILRNAISKDILTALERIRELNEEELKEFIKNGKQVPGATAKPQDFHIQPRVLPKPRSGDSGNVLSLNPIYVELFWAGGGTIWESNDPGNVRLSFSSVGGNHTPISQVYQWWFIFQPIYPGTNDYYSFEMSVSTYCQGSYALDYGEAYFGPFGYNTGNADGWIDLQLTAYQDDGTLLGFPSIGSIWANNIFTGNPKDDFPAITPQPLNLPYNLGFQNYLQPTSANAILVCLEQTFTLKTANNGYGEFDFWDDGDYISCPTLTVFPQP